MAEMSKRILVDIELDPQMEWDDLRFHEGRVRRVVQEVCPDAVVTVRSGGLRWFDANDDHSRAA